MVLRFRTRLSLLIGSLLFLVVSAMTVAVMVIFIRDMWLVYWLQGESRHVATQRSILNSFHRIEDAEERLRDTMVFQALLANELAALATASGDATPEELESALTAAWQESMEHAGFIPIDRIAITDTRSGVVMEVDTKKATSKDGQPVKRTEDGPEVQAQDDEARQIVVVGDRRSGMKVTLEAGEDITRQFTSGMTLDDVIEESLFTPEYERVAIVNGRGEILAARHANGTTGQDVLEQSLIDFCVYYLNKAELGPYDVTLVNRWDLGVVTALTDDSLPEPLALFVVHRASDAVTNILSRLAVIIAVGLIMLLFGVLVSVLMSRSLGKPIVQLSAGAREFGKGNLNYRLRWNRKDEFNDLAQSFNTMAISLQEYMHELEQETSRRERLESEFRIAAEMQQTLLPEKPPEIENLDLIGWSQPSREVGGDFYDFIELGPRRVALVLGDATGKGVSAALLTTECASILRTIAHETQETGEILQRTNVEFHRRVGPTHRFVTLFLMVVDTELGTARYATAGHPPPLLVNATTGNARWLACEPAFPLGIADDTAYQEAELSLEEQDTIVIFSDGLTDIQNERNELYGEQRIEDILTSVASKRLSEMLQGIQTDVDRHMGNREPSDDMTVVIARFKGRVGAGLVGAER